MQRYQKYHSFQSKYQFKHNMQYKNYMENNSPQQPEPTEIQQMSLAQIKNKELNLKRSRPQSDEEEFEQRYQPFFQKKRHYSPTGPGLKKTIANSGKYVNNTSGFAKIQKVYKGSKVNISGFNYLFNEDRCKKVKAGNLKEKTAVESNHQKEKGILSFYYKMRQRFQKKDQEDANDGFGQGQ